MVVVTVMSIVSYDREDPPFPSYTSCLSFEAMLIGLVYFKERSLVCLFPRINRREASACR